MTVLDDRGTRGAVGNTPLRYLVGTFLVLLGMILGLGIASWFDNEGREAFVSYVGPSVERSLAMERSHAVLEEWGRAQGSALGSVAASGLYVGPSVDRSLAMDNSHAVLEEWGRAQAAALGSVAASGLYVGPSVERSLAMERSHDVLEEWGRVHAALLASANG